jgi:hypothetical protein
MVVLQILQWIFSSFWHWLGILLLLVALRGGSPVSYHVMHAKQGRN